MLPHPTQTLSDTKRELATGAPPAPAEVAYVVRNLAGIMASFSRVAESTRQDEIAAIAHQVELKLTSICATLASGSGAGAIGARGQDLTRLTGEALIRTEADEDDMDFAESAGIAITAVDCIKLLRRIAREGGRSGQWQGVEPTILHELAGAAEMGATLDKQATQVVITGGALGRRPLDIEGRRFRRTDPDVDPTPPTPSRGPSL
jgi:hypothetical protein